MNEELNELKKEILDAPLEAELIVVIVNGGFADLVMEAAKRKGARGGTILHARGTGTKEMEKFFGVIISPEKEIVLILVNKELRDDILKEVYKDAGLDTNGQGIAFSLPVSDVIGATI